MYDGRSFVLLDGYPSRNIVKICIKDLKTEVKMHSDTIKGDIRKKKLLQSIQINSWRRSSLFHKMA